MSEYEQTDDFCIDDGQLNEHSPEKCFALGVEFGRFIEGLDRGDPFKMLVHCTNEVRLLRAVVARGGTAVSNLAHDDWTNITVLRTGKKQ